MRKSVAKSYILDKAESLPPRKVKSFRWSACERASSVFLRRQQIALNSPDHQEAMSAYREKRERTFRS